MKQPQIAIEHMTLLNGLRVVVAPDHTVPVVSVGLCYKVGSRLDPRGRGGLAHLFEHMMFQGSANAPKGAHIKLINSSGGRANASTGRDVTNYFAAVPSNTLGRLLWLEADRMQALKLDNENLTNQRDVVKEEIRRNVMTQPYGSFPWLDLPAVAFRNWANAHSLYGDFQDLDAAQLEDLQNFFNTYYVPNNAVLVMLGDVTVEEGITLSMKYFGDIPSGPSSHPPDTNEPEQTEERCGFVGEKLAELPAMAIGYLIPKRRTPDWYAMALLDCLLHSGKAARVNRILVSEKQIAVNAFGGIDDLFSYDGLAQIITQIYHWPAVTRQAVLATFDSIIHEVQQTGVTREELEQLKQRWRSEYFDRFESGGSYVPKYGLMHLIACFTLFDNEPELVNTIVDPFLKVTQEEILYAARKYLKKENRAVVYCTPAKSGNDVVSTGDLS